MTAKEKATQLVEKFSPVVYPYLGSGMLVNQEEESVILGNAIFCSLIVIDEVLRECNKNLESFWYEVESELNKLKVQ